MFDWSKYSYSSILYFNHMSLGMSNTAIGPVLTEMVDILNTSTQSLTLFTTFNAIGFVIGSLFCFLLKYLNRQMVWILYLILMSVCLACVPHSPNIGVLYACALGIGLGSGVLNSIINVWLTELWREKAPTALQVPGLTFGIGTILSPVIIRPFLRKRHLVPNNSTLVNSTNDNDFHWEFNKDYEEDRRSYLTAPFAILAVIQVLWPILMLVMFFLKRYQYNPGESSVTLSKEDKQTVEDQENKLFDRQRQSRKLVIILFSTMVAIFNVYESQIYTFAVTYFQYSSLKLDAPTAAEVITGFTVAYAVCRGLACFVAVKVQPKYILAVSFAISAIGIVLLAATKTIVMLWVSNVVIGIGCSAIMQTMYAFVGQNIRMTDTMSTILVVFFGSFNIAPPYVLGLFVKEHSFVFIVVEVCTLSMCIAIFIILLIIIKRCESLEKSKLNGVCN